MNQDQDQFDPATYLATARRAAGFQTEEAFAKAMGCSADSVRRWESGATKPRPAQLPKLARLLDIAPQDLSAALGHSTSSPATLSFAKPFPVDQLDPDTFESFIEYVLHAKFGDQAVRRAGTSGHTQDGLDIRVDTADGQVLSFQCKRVKQFGPGDARDAIEAHIALADRKHIVLSRVASPQTANLIRSTPGWNILDRNDLSRIVRMDLTEDQQDRLVDIFFAGQRLALLGRTEASPWMTSAEFFAPFEGKDVALSHSWLLTGRDAELAAFGQAIADDKKKIIILVAPGGAGKSRLLKEATGQVAPSDGKTLTRFLSPNGDPVPKSLEALGKGKKILVVDDAHNRERLADLIQLACTAANNATLVLATRPYALARIRREAAQLSVLDPVVLKLESLAPEAVQNLAIQALTHFGAPAALSDSIVGATLDCPLVTVMAGKIVAQEKWPFERAKNSDELRGMILAKFATSSVEHLGGQEDHGPMRKVLYVLALVQPFHIEDPGLHELLHVLTGVDPVDAPRLLKLLAEGGVIYGRRNQYRLMPDLLGDYLIEQSCLTATGRLAPFALKAFSQVKTGYLRNLLINLCRMDWRLRSGNPSDSTLLQEVWDGLSDIENPYDPRLEAIEAVAVYQPRQALDFVSARIREGKTFDRLSTTLRYVSYNFQFVDEVCELLWSLGRDDKRETGPNPGHAIRVLSELCGFEERKPLVFSERVFEFGLSLMDRPGAWDHHYSPLDIVRPVLSGEGSTTRDHGRKFSITQFLVNYDVVAPLRRRLIEKLLQLLVSPSPKAVSRAATTMQSALRRPHNATSRTLLAKYRREFQGTMESLKALLESGAVTDIAALGISRSVLWHAQYGAGALKLAAIKVLGATPKSMEFRLLTALSGGGEALLTGRPFADGWFERQEEWLRSLTTDLRAQFSGAALRDVLDESLSQLATAGDNISNGGGIVFPLLDTDIDLARAIVTDAEAGPASITSQFAATALGKIMAADPAEGRAFALRFLQRPEHVLAQAAASALGWTGRQADREDIALLQAAIASANPSAVVGAIRTIWQWKGLTPRQAIDLLSSAEIHASPRLADDLFLFFADQKSGKRELLTSDDIVRFLAILRPLPTLDGAWLEGFLTYVSTAFSDQFLDFVLTRLDDAIELQSFDHRPINYGPWTHANVQVFETSRSTELLERTWQWMRAHPKRNDFYFTNHVGSVFEGLARGAFGRAAAFFKTKIPTASSDDLQLIGLLLREAPRTFVYDEKAFVEQLLERCAIIGVLTTSDMISDLYASAVSGMRSGTVGQPMTEDVQQRDKSGEALVTVPKTSPAHALYAKLHRSAEQEIEKSVREGEILDE